MGRESGVYGCGVWCVVRVRGRASRDPAAPSLPCRSPLTHRTFSACEYALITSHHTHTHTHTHTTYRWRRMWQSSRWVGGPLASSPSPSATVSQAACTYETSGERRRNTVRCVSTVVCLLLCVYCVWVSCAAREGERRGKLCAAAVCVFVCTCCAVRSVLWLHSSLLRLPAACDRWIQSLCTMNPSSLVYYSRTHICLT